MNADMILIGPMGTGKSTIGKLLAAALHLPQRSMDDIRWAYYKEIGYDEALAKQKIDEEGFWALYQYWKPFEAHAVERLLADAEAEHSACVIDFGAGHSVYEDDALFARIQQVLAPYPNVVLMLPSPDEDESVEILNSRNESLREMKPNINEHFIKHHSNRDLAKFVVFTKGRTPEETRDDILGLIGLKPAADAATDTAGVHSFIHGATDAHATDAHTKTFYDATGKKLDGPPMSLWPSASALVFDARGHLLLQKRADNGFWGLPGGRIDIGESIAETCVREVWEETGFEVAVERLVGVYSDPTQFQVGSYPDGNTVQYVNLCFVCHMTGGQMAVSDESTDIGFFALDALPTPLLESHKVRIQDAQANQAAAFIR